MKRAFVIILLSVCAWMILGAIDNSPANPKELLTMSSWEFTSVYCTDPSTMQYLTPLYNGTTYRFDADGTYSGKFFELLNSGTWETSADMLVLNKGTFKEETYTFSIPTPDTLVLETTEKGNKALLEFVKR